MGAGCQVISIACCHRGPRALATGNGLVQVSARVNPPPEEMMADGKLRRLSKDAAPLQKPNGPNRCLSRTDF